MRRRDFTQGLAFTAALMLGSSALPLPAFAQDKTITGGFDVGPGGFPKNFNPLAATAGFMWLKTYFEPLVIYNADLSALEGALAKSFTVSDDQKTYTFALVSESWLDGKPFTSADVKFTLDLARNKASGSVFAARLASIASVETPDDHTAVVTLSKADGSLLSILAQVMMLPAHALADIAPESLATSQWWSTTPIGTGPFKFSRYVTDQYVELAASDSYRGGRPKVGKLINRYFENAAAAVSALRAGEIQFTYVEPDDAKTFDGDNNFRVIKGDSYVVNYIGFNQKVDLWKDVRVRQELRLCRAAPGAGGTQRLCLRSGEGQGAAGRGRLGQDQRRQADHLADLLRHAAGRQRDGRGAGDAGAGRHQRGAARGRYADL